MNNPEQISPTALGNAQPERRSVRRRLIQSTLFPHKSPEIDLNGVQNGKEEGDEDNDGDYEEQGGSQGKKKGRKRREKGTPQKRATKKGTEKSPVNATPKKNVTCNGKILNDLMEDEHATPPSIPNLRLEARLSAEENSHVFNGKKMHPFFSSWKAGKRNQGTSEEGSNCCSNGKKVRGSTIGPIHVFERIQDAGAALDWREWTFCEKFSTDADCSLGRTFTSVFESSAKALTFDNLPSVLHQPGSSFLQKKEIDQSIGQDELCGRSMAVSCIQLDEPVASCQPLEEHRGDETALCFGKANNLQKLEPEPMSRFVQERLIQQIDGWSDLSHNSLWTDKYQPKNAMEVCGNTESVKFMSEWLHLWHERDSQNAKYSSVCNEEKNLDEDYDHCGSESDSEEEDEENRLKNVLLVTGPIGCGKSAAIYACAKEHGFEILESNTSEYRNGAIVKQKFGEALESHCLARSLENPVDSQSKNMMKSSTALFNGKAAKEFDNEAVDLIQISDEEDSNVVTETSGHCICNEIETHNGRVKVKSLILFEDVDITFPEDRGLVAAIKQIADTAKGPVILTSNSTNPVLPDNFDRLELCFIMPSSEDLLACLNKVCAAEKAQIQPCVIEQLVRCCKGDIRKAIMHLQFWCHAKDVKVQKTCVRLPFDIEAAHQVLPNIMPWGFPSQLSILIDEEIARSLAMRMEDLTLTEAIKEEGLDDGETLNSLEMRNAGKDSIAAKKEEMLSRNFSVQDCNELFSPSDSVYEISDSLGTPVSCSVPTCRRKFLIMSSDSEDEHVDKASVDMSQVPESSFVPETEMDNGLELSSRTISNAIAENIAISVCNNFAHKQPGDEAVDFLKYSDQLVSSSNILGSPDIIEEMSNEEFNYSQAEHNEAASIGHDVMDECSRMDFVGRSNHMKKLKYHDATDLVQESWKKLRESTVLKDYVSSMPSDAFHIVRCTHKVCDLFSEADWLLSKSQMLDNSEPTVVTSENSDEFSWCDEQLYMYNIISQHGFCLYTKDIAAVGPTMDSEKEMDWDEEMLFSTSNTMALGRLLGRSECASQLSLKSCSELRPSKNEVPLQSKIKSRTLNIMKSILPSRSYSALTGDAYHEYISSLRCISRAEASRLSFGINKTNRRRGRVARHYLSSGGLTLSAEDISFLDQSKLSGNITS